MNLNKTKFFDTDEVYISSRMNAYLKKNFGYEITGDLEALREAKASLEVTKAELKDEYMSAKYVENMLMIETITSLLKAHGSTKSESVNEEIMTKGGFKVKFNAAIRKIVHQYGSNYLTLAMKKFGINSLDDLKTDADKQKFFNYVDSIHTTDWRESVNEDLYSSDKTIPKDIVISGESVEDRVKDCLDGACWWPGRTNDEDDSHFYEHGLAEKIAKMMCDVFGVDHTSKLPHNIETPLEDAVHMETNADQGARSDKPLSHGNESEIIEAIYQTKKEFEKYIMNVNKSPEASVTGEERRRRSKEKRENTDMNEEDVTVDNEGNIAGYLDYIDECIDQINHDNLSEMAYRIQNAVDDIRTRELDLKASLIRDKFNEIDTPDDEVLLNKAAEWIYSESTEPISEIEYLLKKADAVGQYMDAVEYENIDELPTKVAQWIYHESTEPISEIEHLLKKSGAVGDYMDAVSESKESLEEEPGDQDGMYDTGKDYEVDQHIDKEKGPDHYRWKNDSQLAVALGRIESAMKALDHAIEYRGENSHLLMRGGDKAGVGDLMRIKEKLVDIHSNWEKETEYYGM